MHVTFVVLATIKLDTAKMFAFGFDFDITCPCSLGANGHLVSALFLDQRVLRRQDVERSHLDVRTGLNVRRLPKLQQSILISDVIPEHTRSLSSYLVTDHFMIQIEQSFDCVCVCVCVCPSVRRTMTFQRNDL